MHRPGQYREPTEPKKARHSKTHRFNTLMAGLTTIEANVSLLQPLLDSYGINVYAMFSIILLVGNSMIRQWWTTGPLQ